MTLKVVDLIPASSAYEVSKTLTPYAWRSQYLRYMRETISAQSAASTPPASERIVTRASRWSYSPLKRVCTSKSEIAVVSESNSFSTSVLALVSLSALASSNMMGRS